METADRMLGCRTCGKEFVFTSREQEFFTSKGFDEPRHCPECRAQRKREKNSGGGTAQPAMQTPHQHPTSADWSEVVCASCGQPASVPFRPTSGRPVFCRDCFSAQKTSEAVKPRVTAPARPTAPHVTRPSASVQSSLPKIPQHVLEEDMGPLPDFDPAPDEEGEITVAEFVPMGGSFGATSEEVDPIFEEDKPGGNAK